MTELEKEAVNYLLKRLSIDIDEFEKWKENARSEVKFIVDCYVAGAEAHSIQWHDLRKDPNDLPEEGVEVLNDDGVKVIRIKGHWRYVYGGEWEDDASLDHWCEIPKFEE